MDDRTLLAIDAIRRDSRSGAVELANRAALLLIEYCDTYRAEAFERELTSLCRALIGAQPSMAPLLNLCNAVLRAAEHPGIVYPEGRPQPATPPQAASNAALRFYAFLAHHPRRIANEMLPYIHSGALLLTHSSSATVLAALLRAHEAGKRFGVVCTESRPLYEGVSMARQLAEAGIGVEVIADAAAAVFVHGFYALLIGADAITSEGVLNKVGTLGMALAARTPTLRNGAKLRKSAEAWSRTSCTPEPAASAMRRGSSDVPGHSERVAGVPVYCLAGSEKLVPAGAELSIEEKNPAEIVESGPNLRGFNIYFDQTPLDLITKFFTEDGVLTPDEIRERLSAVSLHPALLPEPP